MGNLLFRSRKRGASRSVSGSSTILRSRSTSTSRSRSRSRSSSFAYDPFDQLPERNLDRSFSASTSANFTETKGSIGSSSGMSSSNSSSVDKKKKYGFIADNFTSFDQVFFSCSYFTLMRFISCQIAFLDQHYTSKNCLRSIAAKYM